MNYSLSVDRSDFAVTSAPTISDVFAMLRAGRRQGDDAATVWPCARRAVDTRRPLLRIFMAWKRVVRDSVKSPSTTCRPDARGAAA